MKVKISNSYKTIILDMNIDQYEIMKHAIERCLEGKSTHINYKDPKSNFMFPAEYLKTCLIEFCEDENN